MTCFVIQIAQFVFGAFIVHYNLGLSWIDCLFAGPDSGKQSEKSKFQGYPRNHAI